MQATTTVEGFRLSPQQRRLWALQQDATLDASAFGARLTLRLEGGLRPDALRDALGKVCARHESLRTIFRRLPGVLMPVQSVDDGLSPSWRVVEPGGADAREREAEVEELLALEDRLGFDFERGPLVRATLYVLSAELHLLSVSLPALCADRRTLNNLFSELARCYAAAIEGGEFEDEPFKYLQFSEWQNTLWDEDEAVEGKEYWGRQDLSAASAALPGQRRTGGDARGELRSVTSTLSPENTARVAAVARRFETTGATVLLAAWQTLLWRLAQQPILVGVVYDGRQYELLHDAFGLFARALPVSCLFTDGLRFDEVIAQLDSFQRETAEWQDYFEWEQGAAEGRHGYFAFGYEYGELPAARRGAGLGLSVYSQRCYIERFNLKLNCAAAQGATGLEFQYDAALFREDDVRRIAGQFQTLLEGALANPEALVEELEIVTDAERQQILFGWNRTGRDYPLEQCLHQIFERQVERTPDALAVVFQDRRLTFDELNRRANQLAHQLRARGVGAEVPVGLCVERSPEMIVGVLGILKAGGAYLPLDPRNPHERLKQVLKDVGAPVVLTQQHLLPAIEFEGVAQLIRLDSDWESQIAGEGVENQESGACADNLAYVIYTSGSTGQPKGVMIQHRSAVNLAAALGEEVYAGQGAGLQVGLNAPLAFDASVKQLLQLLSGHTIHLLPEELRLDAARLLEYLDVHALDSLDCTPSQLKLMLAAGLGEQSRRVPKVVLVGGEPLDETIWPLLAADRRTRFYNVYGPTECTVDATWVAAQDAPERPTIGRPIPNARVYILDKNLQPVAVHMTGELYIGGSGLARGYLNQPALTAERFVPDGLSGEGGGRLYRTGDLGRYLADGRIEFLGRNDSQVKVRGHRIELGEIEAVLRGHEAVRQAVVVARDGGAGGARLVGYVVAEGGAGVEAAELRRAAGERLPEYMVPAMIVVLDELPLTRNGKVDLDALPAPEAVRTPSDERYVAPRNEIEETITRIWQEVLQVERIGVHDNFFDAGGHSLLMVQVHNRLGEVFGKGISIVEMFGKPTISALAEHLGGDGGHKPTFQKVIDRAERRKQAAHRRKS